MRSRVVRNLVGRVFGFDREIQQLREALRELRWDSAFDMFTRTAFLQLCRVMPRGPRTIAFFDFDDIHGLNIEVGYAEVDRRIRETFSIPFRSSDLVARWYSGDEIVVLFDSDEEGARTKVAGIRESAHRNGLDFVYEIGVWDVGRSNVVEVVDDLSARCCRSHGAGGTDRSRGGSGKRARKIFHQPR